MARTSGGRSAGKKATASRKATPKKTEAKSTKTKARKTKASRAKAVSDPRAALEGRKAPAVTLPTDTGETFRLADQNGRWVVLYFYPKAMTPGCTLESRDFSALLPAFQKKDAVVVGISPDAPERLARFREKEGLRHVLASDPDHRVAERYGAWGEKKLYGKTYEGIIRSTFLIGPDLKVSRVWPKVKVKGHAEEVLAAIP
ncbi:MAG: thioredoxin-dependent thiol peroxidase [Deltaproteobacteria bacterium]|nr:MAG: thioredoxin-dependent thiol peroxidase [Deltaproteobacteria bacterium]